MAVACHALRGQPMVRQMLYVGEASTTNMPSPARPLLLPNTQARKRAHCVYSTSALRGVQNKVW